MAIAIARTDAQRSELELDLPPTWLAATKVVLMVAFLTALVLAVPVAAILGLQSVLG